MSIVDRWLLPDGVEDVLPPQAGRLEAVRRTLLDLYATWGYEYVVTPMVEYLESLLTGTGRDLDLKTLKVTDLVSGRTMGVRADITPQVARIDAHSLKHDGVTRLCYAGTVVQSEADGMLESRTPMKVGAELFGDASIRGDVEIVCLMIESMQTLGFETIHIDLGDVSIFRHLVSTFGLSEAQQETLFASVQRKSVQEIQRQCDAMGLSDGKAKLLVELPLLCGAVEMLDRARSLYAEIPELVAILNNLDTVAEEVAARYPAVDLYFDLGELRGYAYHTGIVFAAHVDGVSQTVAKGGRYDHIGAVFGREGRGATGFSVNVLNVAESASIEFEARPTVLVSGEGAGLWEEICRLRGDGYTVVESGNAEDYDFCLVQAEGKWQLMRRESHG